MKHLFFITILIGITVVSCAPTVNQGNKEPHGNIMGKMIEHDKQLRGKMEARKAREAEAQRKVHEQKVKQVKAQIRLREQKAREAQKKLADVRRSGKLISKSVSEDRVILTYQNGNIYTTISMNKNGNIINIHESTFYSGKAMH